jgi:hypothetical protein
MKDQNGNGAARKLGTPPALKTATKREDIMPRNPEIPHAELRALRAVVKAALAIRETIGTEAVIRAHGLRLCRGSGGQYFISHARLCNLDAALRALTTAKFAP